MFKSPTMQQLLEAGVHFGHQTRRGNPRMQRYIYGARDGVHIINLEDTEKLLQDACNFVNELGQQGKRLLFIGTKKQAQSMVAEAAKSADAAYINYRWMGGILTNFDELRKNIKKILDLKDQREKGELARYTKKEQLLISRKIEKFETEIGGIAKLDRLPDAVFILDAVGERTALNEARRMNLPIVAIADTNSDPMQIDYPIPGNDDATKSIKIILDAIAAAYQEGLEKAGAAKKVAEEKKAADAKKAEEKESAAVSDEVAVIEQEVEKEVVKDSERVV